jgi:hypothetical protein
MYAKRKPQPPPQLPTRIRIGRRLYSIDVVETLINKGDMARHYPALQKIKIAQRSNLTGKRFKQEEINDSFWHEIVHAILHDMNEHALNKNEEFVTAFANRLTKAIKSARFE